jgi:hypothetical protein
MKLINTTHKSRSYVSTSFDEAYQFAKHFGGSLMGTKGLYFVTI